MTGRYDWPTGYQPDTIDELAAEDVINVLTNAIERLEGRHGMPPLQRAQDGDCEDCTTHGRRYTHGRLTLCRTCATRRRRLLPRRDAA